MPRSAAWSTPATRSAPTWSLPADDAADVVARYAGPLGDDVRLVAVSERMVAITQGRSYPISDIRPGRLARFLERHVTRPGYGIGLGSAETMELAIHEVGAPRILLAAAASAVTRPFGVARRLLPGRRTAGRGPSMARRATRSRPTTRPPRSARRTPTARRARSPPRSTRRWRSSTRTTPAARCSAPARASTAASSSASLPTTRSARRASRPRSASCARWSGRPDRELPPEPKRRLTPP